ncbi:MAG: hypothetical protein ACJ8C4_14355 [Gemmataceae bacterium]
MTRASKYLIFINLALSLIFVAWSIGLYTQRVPWTTMGAGDERVVGRIDELTAQIKSLTEARDRAEDRWFGATREVLRLTKDMRDRRRFYVEQMQMGQLGTNLAGQPVKPAVQQLQYDADRLLVLKDTGRPAYQIDGKDALSVAGYRAVIEQQLDEIRATKVKINKVVADTTVLTRQIAGTKPADQAITAVEKGLRGQILDTQTVINGEVLEQQYLQTPITNYTVDVEFMRRRQLTLESRLKELSASAMRLVSDSKSH